MTDYGFSMHGFTCDVCGKNLLIDEDVRYEVKIEVKAAYDPMELTDEDLKKDYRKEIAELLRRMKTMDPQALEDQVYKLFHFDMCPACQLRYLRNPLGTRPPGGSTCPANTEGDD
jgi:hypothetical protein